MSNVPIVQPVPDVLSFFRALADETRLAIVRLLALTDLRAGELVERLHQPQNAVSYHLKQLRALGLLRDRRSSRDARDVYYSVDIERLQTFYHAIGDALHPGIAAKRDTASVAADTQPRLRILFLCTHNRARSQLAEGITRYLAGDHVDVYSAGDHATEVHPLTVEMLSELGIDTSRHHAKDMQQFVGQHFDYVITTCDYVTGNCPTFPGDPHRIHWSCDDPSIIDGGIEEQRAAFRKARRELMTRIRYLLAAAHVPTRST